RLLHLLRFACDQGGDGAPVGCEAAIADRLTLLQLERLERMLLLFLCLVFFALAGALVDDAEELALFALEVFLTLGSLLVVPQCDVRALIVWSDDGRELHERPVPQGDRIEIVVADEGDPLLVA